VDLNKLQIESFRKELRTDKGFTWNAWDEAARYCLENNVNLEEGMVWAEKAVSEPFIGQANFNTLSTKARYLVKLGKLQQADSIMKNAIAMGNMNQIHNYARQLLAEKRSKEAYEVFKMNYDKNPNTFTTNMGMARGYSATGNYKKAAEFAAKALPQAPDGGNRVSVENIITKLKEGKDIN
jgi:tetratricopeptide (TPR) repeat protein